MKAPIVFIKEAAPWGSIIKGVTAAGSKVMANPLGRRAVIGAGVGGSVGGAGNVLFGSPEQGSIAKRWAKGTLGGMALGAAGGTAYHGATRLGMPTLSSMMSKSTKVPTAVKAPKVSMSPSQYRANDSIVKMTANNNAKVPQIFANAKATPMVKQKMPKVPSFLDGSKAKDVFTPPPAPAYVRPGARRPGFTGWHGWGG